MALPVARTVGASTEAVGSSSIDHGASAMVEVSTGVPNRERRHISQPGRSNTSDQPSNKPTGALRDTTKHNRRTTPYNTDKFGNRLYSRPRRPRLPIPPAVPADVLPTVAEEAQTGLSQDQADLPETKQHTQPRRRNGRGGFNRGAARASAGDVHLKQGAGASDVFASEVWVAQFSAPPRHLKQHPHLGAAPVDSHRTSPHARREPASDHRPTRNMRRELATYVPPHVRHAIDRNATPPTSPETKRGAAPGGEVCEALPSSLNESVTHRLPVAGGMALSAPKWARLSP